MARRCSSTSTARFATLTKQAQTHKHSTASNKRCTAQVNGNTNWSTSMDRYIGKVGIVTRLSGVDCMGCPGVRCSFDGVPCNSFFRVRDLTIVKL